MPLFLYEGIFSVLLFVKFFSRREGFLCLSFVIFVTFVVRGLLSLAGSRPFLTVRFGFSSLSSGFWFPLSVLRFLCSSAFQRSWVCVLVAAPSRSPGKGFDTDFFSVLSLCLRVSVVKLVCLWLC